jgi:hypothetical protein
MRRIFAPAAVAAVALSFALPTVAFADHGDSTFDLGIGVEGVHRTQPAVDQFLSSLTPSVQKAVMGGCQTYVAHPSSATNPSTVPFCRLAMSSHAIKPVAMMHPATAATAAAPKINHGSAIDWHTYY